MPSLKEIATKAGVSIGTVDRVLHKRGRVSRKTQSRVEKIVARLDYRPNIYARNLSLAKVFVFGVLMPKRSQDSGYWHIPARGIERAHTQLDAARVRILFFHFDRYSEISFERAFQKALHSGLDGFLIAPVLQDAAQRLISTIPPRVPFVFFDSMIPGTNPLASIGQDPFQSGIVAASLMSKTRCAHGTVAIVKVIPEDFHINERLRGFKTGIDLIRSVRTVEYEVNSHQGDDAFRKTVRRILADNRNLVGVYVTNAWTHPIARHLAGLGNGKQYCVIGYDLVEKNQECLGTGLIDFLISQRPTMQGFEGISALYRNVVLRDKVAKTITVPLDIITKDNVRYCQD